MSAMRDLNSGLNTRAPSALQARFSHGAVAAGVLVALVGGGHLIAWLTGTMTHLGFSAITMKTNMALGLLLAGLVLVVVTKAEAGKGWRLIANTAAVFILMVSLATLLENIGGWNLGIDQLLATEPPGALGVSDSNRFGVPGALCLILTGAALLILNDRLGRGGRIAQALALGVCAISLLGVLGYFYEVRGLYVLNRWTAIAWPTAVALFVTGIGLLLARPERGFMAVVTADDPGGAMLRALLLPTTGLLAALGWLRVLGERRGLYETALGTSMLVLGFAILFTGLVYVTARKMSQLAGAERAAQRAMQRQAKLIDLTPAAVMVWQVDGTVRFWSEGARLLYGWSQQEAIGRRTHDLLRTQFPEPLEAIIARLKEGGRWSGELRQQTKEGRELVALSSWLAQLTPDGEIAEILESNIDITARKNVEDALRESEERLRLALDAAQFGTFDFKPLTGELGWDAQTKQIWGLRPSEETDYAHALERIHAEDRERVSQSVAASFAPDANGDFAVEYRIGWPDGTIHWSNAKGHVYFQGQGEQRQAIRMVGVQRDITGRKQAEETALTAKEELTRVNETLECKVQERTAKLQEMVAELEHFSYTITHDMRAPLRAMQGFGNVLLGECADCLPPARRDFIRRIAEAAGRMDQLITDALNFSKIMRHQFDLLTLDPAASLRGIIESYPQFQPPRAEVVLSGEFPPIVANEAGLTQVFSNLLGNAVKFMDPGKTPQVRVWAETRDDFVRLWFEDNGIGVEQEYQDKIWVMFQRLDKSREGTGIGLALVKKAVERMRGQVGVESEPGKGSRFWVEFRRG